MAGFRIPDGQISESGANMENIQTTPKMVVDFWQAAGPARWFAKDSRFDAEIRKYFLMTWEQAKAGKLAGWAAQDEGLLALVLVFDQFPRNMFRDDPRAFSTDEKAREMARLALQRQVDTRTERALRGFLYLPFEHSENTDDQALSVRLFQQLGEKEMLRYALLHEDIIRKFGRFPHRNAILGRKTTAREQDFLDQGGFAG